MPKNAEVVEASSATGISLVPAETMRIVPFPLDGHILPDGEATGCLVIAAFRKGVDEPIALLLIDPRGEHVDPFLRHGADDLRNLLECLAFAEDDLLDAFPELPVKIDLRVRQVLERHVFQLLEGSLHGDGAVGDRGKEREDAFIHVLPPERRS